jgi:hypothetical protein
MLACRQPRERPLRAIAHARKPDHAPAIAPGFCVTFQKEQFVLF